ncbi:hypothetical protein ASPWEDRAFT_103198 [Aspergillus wentii DTO 134E9]|uniref:Uncharacterized protein n=1 Tax=Aspergillus wentii DTO 134E9 TaxID=1073089 RepID=A0A1L9RV51_ASPWE|nr:uncharacterized protein ASPWEDRAFT_103198 [Aspergillus wentii DTO 134E9]OJJ38810.1 hypothetical protein ASPWEDRAFT_103198 [Aspergillus wentii DTO 134E9]
MADLTIYNAPTVPPKYDQVGVFYIAFCVTWSTLLVAGMIFCWFNRHIPIIRIRGLPLSFSAIALLHVYWIMGQITYPVGQAVPTVLAYDLQYFAMGIYYPLGIALFQASNLRFLHVAKMQKQFAHPELRSTRRCNGGDSSWLCRLRNMDYMTRTLTFIGIGMALQFAITVGMWFACMKYHPTYGIPGTEIKGATLPEQMADLSRGWEWWPSLLWQVIWTWVAAPILIWRAWGIRDTMGWRTQTIVCCVASLHAVPMFMVASYVPSFAKVNVYFPPSQWIHVSIIIFEIFTVFVPIFELIRLRILSEKASSSNAKYDPSSLATVMRTTPSTEWKNTSSSTLAEKGLAIDCLEEYSGDRLFTMDALEHVLAKNPEPLQDFAAFSDFSGENIAFLSHAAAWKASLPEPLEKEHMYDAFNQALQIYITFISIRDAEFPLNISSQSLKHLESVFEKPARAIYGEGAVNAAVPFEVPSSSPAPHEISIARYTDEIPDGFNMAIFDDVQNHVKYLILTNTWPKFVEAMRRRTSVSTAHSDITASSDRTLATWVSVQSEKLKSLF